MRALPLLSVGWAWLALALALTCPADTVAADSPPVKVQLRASWSKIRLHGSGSPFLLELLEAAQYQRPSSFFPLIELLTSKYSAAELRDASDAWLANTVEDIIKAHHLFGTSQENVDAALDTWRLSLALSNSSPRIQALVQLYQTLGMEETWRKGSSGASCVSWIHHRDQVLCSAEDVKRALQDNSTSIQGVNDVSLGHHRTKGTVNSAAVKSFVLYADPYSDNFRELFSTLEEYAGQTDANLNYILRWRPSAHDFASAPASGAEHTTLLSGYGATLDLKKVDYLVIDDRKLKDDSNIGDVGIAANSQSEEGNAARQASEDVEWLQEQIGAETGSTVSLSSFSEDQIADIGIKAARLVMGSSDPLRALAELSQNFPAHAAALASTTKWDDPDATAELVDSVLNLASMRIEPGHSDLWLNGQSTPTRDFIPLALLETLKQERRWNHALQHRLAGGELNVTEAGDLISSSLVGRAYQGGAGNGADSATFDASDRIEMKNVGGDADVGAITWLNDLEKDDATSDWSNDLMDLLRPMWPGKFPRLSINLFNVVLVLDLKQKESCRFLSDTVIQSLGRVGLHWGLVPGGLEDDSDVESIRMARLVWFLLDEASPQVASDVLRKAAVGKGIAIDTSLAIKEAKFALKSFDTDPSLAARLDEALAGNSLVYTQKENLAKAYIKRLRATRAESSTGHVFVNGQHQHFHPQMVHMLHQAIQEQIQVLAPQIYYGQISSGTPGLETVFYDMVGALSFRSALVGGSASVGETEEGESVRHSVVDMFSALVDGKIEDAITNEVFNFFYPERASDRLLNSTVWVIADLNSRDGLALLTRSFEALATEDAKFRLGLLHLSSTSSTSSHGSAVSTLMHRLFAKSYTESVTPRKMLALLQQAHDDPHVSIAQLWTTLDLPQDAESDDGSARFWNALSPISTHLSLSARPSILVDGHLVSNLDPAAIESRDIIALVEYEAGQKLPYITQALSLLRPSFDTLPAQRRQDLLFAAVSVLNGVYAQDLQSTSKAGSRSGLPEQLGTSSHVFEIGSREDSDIRITLLLNPLSEAAQRWSSIMRMLSSMQGVWLRVILNPEIKLREMPLKRFYRFSSPSRLSFDLSGKAISPELRFFNMPEEAVLTLGLDAPAPWLTMPMEAVYDLDNIRLADVPLASKGKGVKAIYELKHILIEGHARERTAQGTTVPRGLQLLLETPDRSTRLDTIVMANLAYFQFKASPGVWKLRIRPGRSDELYEMEGVGAEEEVVLVTFSGLTIYPHVAKRRGKEKEALLEELDSQGRPVKNQDGETMGGFLASAKGKVASLARHVTSVSGSSKEVMKKHADINIFTIASGHLYERMTYIMILSVLKHTNSSVKFWFIENFLSPSFKEFIPHLAEEYGFEYELVTYAWPHWLRSQKEKQRTIWGYKILFLDTLFPLDLGKVIFVDADQVVRSDLMELVNLDLEGKVYAYPPMGDDSYDMDGFRFWKQGYWKDYLRGRPYHISALYVVDLYRFRLFAAGDRLRGQYQALSADPNSLSNLDQDLPNNMQASLPIHTLEKEWLWCETWCSQDWLKDAKTIDLCSNPKTKEPKLERARRQIPEWSVYDAQVASLAQRLVQGGRVGKSVVAPESQVHGREETAARDGEVRAEDGAHVHDEL